MKLTLDERNRLGKGGRADRDRDRRDDQQGHEIRREPEQRISDRGPGERQEQRRESRLFVDPRSKRRAEGDRAERSRSQNGA